MSVTIIVKEKRGYPLESQGHEIGLKEAAGGTKGGDGVGKVI